MLLLVDIGNTQTVIGIGGDGGIRQAWRVQTVRGKTADELRILLHSLLALDNGGTAGIRDMAVSSVVPELNRSWEHAAQALCGQAPLFVGPGTRTGMPILLDNPREVGADRVVNAVAAYESAGGAAVVVDFGTATTFDVVSGRGEYLGGAICPGPLMGAESLARNTSRLHRVEVADPGRVIGRSTAACIQSGLFYGYLGTIEGMLSRIREELPERPLVIATGGLAEVFSGRTGMIDRTDPDLSLRGLQIIWERSGRGE